MRDATASTMQVNCPVPTHFHNTTPPHLHTLHLHTLTSTPYTSTPYNFTPPHTFTPPCLHTSIPSHLHTLTPPHLHTCSEAMEDFNQPSPERIALLECLQQAIGSVPPHIWAACQICDPKALERLVNCGRECPGMVRIFSQQTYKMASSCK
jgi:hypothetical protein